MNSVLTTIECFVHSEHQQLSFTNGLENQNFSSNDGFLCMGSQTIYPPLRLPGPAPIHSTHPTNHRNIFGSQNRVPRVPRPQSQSYVTSPSNVQHPAELTWHLPALSKIKPPTPELPTYQCTKVFAPKSYWILTQDPPTSHYTIFGPKRQ